MMRHLSVGLLNLDQADLTIAVMANLSRLPSHEWQVQMILVDNGSHDDDIQRLFEWTNAHKSQFDDVLFISSSRNRGATGGRNIIFERVEGDRILMLDNDVILPEDFLWLETLWKRMDDDPRAAIVAPVLVFTDYPDIVQSAGIGLTEQGKVGYLFRGDLVESIPSGLAEVVAFPTACWLLNRKAQEEVGLLSEEFFPVQYEDVDFCVRLGQAGWKILSDRGVFIKHIENVTTKNLEDYSFARITVKHGMKFRKKWQKILPEIATLTDEDIYWAPIPRARD
jgi:GT2 family glycosyltransferase